ncbi:MAG: protein kinase [Planctomycetales bacterium]|nr:protein kinase [Planctomycetales bacterium]
MLTSRHGRGEPDSGGELHSMTDQPSPRRTFEPQSIAGSPDEVSAESLNEPKANETNETVDLAPSHGPTSFNETVGADTAPAPVDATIDMPPVAPSVDGATASASGRQASPRSFGEYELLEEIARGGMGVVYKARQTKLDRIVALKMILTGQFASDADVQRFHAEARAAGQLDHPGIVPIFQIGELDGKHYFSMGFVDGESLQDRIHRGVIGPRESAELVKEVAEAVAAAHAQGVVHRDLKPGNILIGSDGRARVTDFGLAKSVSSTSDSAVTMTGQVLGTPAYMPPEQAAGRIEEIGECSDVYALGGVLYCMVTGRPPFQAASVVETLRQVMESPAASPRVLNPAVDRDLETIILRCLEKAPRDRIESAQELARELERYLAGEPIRSRRLGAATKAWRWCRRRPALVGMVLACVAALALLPALLSTRRAAAAAQEVSRLQIELESELEQLTLDSDWSRVQTLAERLRGLNPDVGEKALSKFDATAVSRIRSALQQPRLTDNQLAATKAAIARLPSSVAEREQLAQAAAQRTSTWILDYEIHSEDAEFASYFEERTLQRDRGESGGEVWRSSLRLPAQAWTETATPAQQRAPLHAIASPQRGDSRVVAEFEADWEQSHEVGIAMNAVNGEGYDFVLTCPWRRGDPVAASSYDSERRTVWTLAQERAHFGEFRVEIRRAGRLMLRDTVSAQDVPVGRLRLEAQRVDGMLRLQVNQIAFYEVLDPFELRPADEGVTGVRMLNSTTLAALLCEHRQQEHQSALREADASYGAGQYAIALSAYQQLTGKHGENIEQELAFKRAQCLLNLDRKPEAMELLRALSGADGERWPALAAIALWDAAVQEGDEGTEAAMFELLSTRFAQQAPALVDEETRGRILRSAIRGFTTLTNLLTPGASRLERVERAAAVDRMLSADGQGTVPVRYELARALRLNGQHERATQILKENWERTRNAWDCRHYARILRVEGQWDLADAAVREALAMPSTPRRTAMLLIERARNRAPRGDDAGAEVDIDASIELDESVTALFVKGCLMRRRGDLEGAREHWARGYALARRTERSFNWIDTTNLQMIAMGGLSQTLTSEDAIAFHKQFGGQAPTGMIGVLRSLVSAEQMPQLLTGMWHLGRANELVEQLAFETVSVHERLFIPVSLAGHWLLLDRAFGKLPSADDEAVCWELQRQALQRLLVDQSLSMSQVMQLGFAWKGTLNLLGWGGVQASLEPELRARFAYVLAHKLLRQGNRDDARKLLETAAEPTSPETIRSLAANSLRLLSQGQGRLVFQNECPREMRLELSQGDARQVVELAPHTTEAVTFDLATGKWGVSISEADGMQIAERQQGGPLLFQLGAAEAIALDSIAVEAGKTIDVHVRTSWSEAATARLPGPLDRPASIASQAVPNATTHWQLTRVGISGRSSAAWSPDSAWLAISGEGERGFSLHAVPAPDQLPHQIVLGHQTSVVSLAWSPGKDRLLSVDAMGECLVWDIQARKLVRRLRFPQRIHTVNWSPDGRRFVAASLNAGVWIVNLDDLSQRRVFQGTYVTGVEWQPSGAWLLILDVGGKAMAQLVDSEGDQRSRQLGEGANCCTWTSDGKQIVLGLRDELALFDLEGNKIRGVPRQYTNHVAARPNSHAVTATGWGSQLVYWDTTTNESRSGRGAMAGSWWRPAGDQLAIRGESGIQMVDPEFAPGQFIGQTHPLATPFGVALLPNDTLLVASACGVEHCGATVASEASHATMDAGVVHFARAVDGPQFVTMRPDRRIEVWSWDELGKCRPVARSKQPFPGTAWQMAASQQGRTIFVVTYNQLHVCRLAWDEAAPNTSADAAPLEVDMQVEPLGQFENPSCLAADPLGDWVAVGRKYGPAMLVHNQTKERVALSDGNDTRYLLFSRDGQQLLGGGANLRRWRRDDWSTNDSVATTDGDQKRLVWIDEAQTQVATVSEQGAIGRWDVATGRWETLLPACGPVAAIDLDPASGLAAVGLVNGFIRTVDLRRQRLVHVAAVTREGGLARFTAGGMPIAVAPEAWSDLGVVVLDRDACQQWIPAKSFFGSVPGSN